MVIRRILPALSLLSLLACSGQAPATQPPTIHFDQTAVLTIDGEVKEEQAYRATLEECHKAGLPTHALTPDEVAKIGRVHVEAWIAPDKQARHDEEWHLNSDHPCEFHLLHQDMTQIGDANGRVTMIDGVTHQVTVEETGKPGPVVALPPEDGELTEGERQAGWIKKSQANANGAACAIWQDSTGFQLCVWTGGRQWGYSADGPTALREGVSRGDSVVFWAHPNGGVAWRLETKEFSLGQPLDPRAFALPKNTPQGPSQ